MIPDYILFMVAINTTVRRSYCIILCGADKLYLVVFIKN